MCIMFVRIQGTGTGYETTLLCLCTIFLFADQNLLSPNLTSIANEFGFNDKAKNDLLGGRIALGFFLVGGTASVIIGYLADVLPGGRLRLFALVVLVGGLGCFFTYWSTTYQSLLLCRIITGIGIGGATPIIFSLLADFYDEKSRVKASSLVGISMSSGIAVGQMLAGFLGPSLGWRAPFLVVSIPAMLTSILIYFTCEEPARGVKEEEMLTLANANLYPNNQPPDGVVGYSALSTEPLSNKNGNAPPGSIEVSSPLSARGGSAGGDSTSSSVRGLHVLDPRVIQSWYTDWSSRSFDWRRHSVTSAEMEQCSSLNTNTDKNTTVYPGQYSNTKVKDMMTTPSVIIIILQGIPGCVPWGMMYVFMNDFFSNEQHMSVPAATALLATFAVGVCFGQLIGGYIGQFLLDKSQSWQILLMGLSTILSVIPILYLLEERDKNLLLMQFTAMVSGLLVSINGPNVRVVLQRVCLPEVRGSAFALFTLTDDIGKGLGPLGVGALINYFDGDRRRAFGICCLFLPLCGLMLLLLLFTVENDAKAVQEKVKTALQNKESQGNGSYSNDMMSLILSGVDSASRDAFEMVTPRSNKGTKGRGQKSRAKRSTFMDEKIRAFERDV